MKREAVDTPNVAKTVDEVLEASIREANEGINSRADARLKPDLEDGVKIKGEKDLKLDLKNSTVKKTADRVAENKKIAADNTELRRKAQRDIDRTNRSINNQRDVDIARSEKSLRTTAKNTGGAGKSVKGKDIPMRTGAQRKAADNWMKWKHESNPKSKAVAEDYYKKGNPGFKKPKSKSKTKPKSKYAVPKKDWYFDKANAIDNIKTWDGYGKARMEQASLASQGKPARHVNPPTEAVAGTRPTNGFGSAKYSYNPKAVPKTTTANKALSVLRSTGGKAKDAAKVLLNNPIVNNPVTRFGAKVGGSPLWLAGESYGAITRPTRAEFKKKGNTFRENFEKNGGISAAAKFGYDAFDSAFDWNPHWGKEEGFWNTLLGSNIIDLDENAQSRIQDVYIAGKNALRPTGDPKITAADIYAPKGTAGTSKQSAAPFKAPGPDLNRGVEEANAFMRASKEEQDAYLEAHGSGDAAGAAELMAGMRKRYTAQKKQLEKDRGGKSADFSMFEHGDERRGDIGPIAGPEIISDTESMQKMQEKELFNIRERNISGMPDELYGSRPGSQASIELNGPGYQIQNDPKKRTAAYYRMAGPGSDYVYRMGGKQEPLGQMIGAENNPPMALKNDLIYKSVDGTTAEMVEPQGFGDQAAAASPMQYGDGKFGENLPMQPLPGERLNAAFDATNPQEGPRVNPLRDAFYGMSEDIAQRRMEAEQARAVNPAVPPASPIPPKTAPGAAVPQTASEIYAAGMNSLNNYTAEGIPVIPAPSSKTAPGKPSKPSKTVPATTAREEAAIAKAEALVASQQAQDAVIRGRERARSAYYDNPLNPLGSGSGYGDLYRAPNQAFLNRQRG